MFDDLRKYYTDRLLLLYRYKKNLIDPVGLEDEIFKLNCLYKIWGWVKEKHWIEYTNRIEAIIGIYCVDRKKTIQAVSPEQELEVEWVNEDGTICIIEEE